MKAVILAGGFGTRLSEETGLKPKPMVEIGGMPILWHLMKLYSHHGVNEFIICCGYKGNMIKDFFTNYFIHSSDFTIDLKKNSLSIHKTKAEDWKVTLVDTGEKSMTGGRLKRIEDFVKHDDCFCFTYGDGLSDVNIGDTIKFHQNHKKYATITAVNHPNRFGLLNISESIVEDFREKPKDKSSFINGGFFVLSPSIFSYLKNDETVWEEEPLRQLALNRQLKAYEHRKFWQPMDTLNDRNILEKMWNDGKAPWKVW